MINDELIPQLVNYNKKTLEQEVNLLKIDIKLANNPPIILGYCATENSIYEQVVTYLQKQTNSKTKPLEINLKPDTRNLREYLLKNIKMINSLDSEIVLIKAKGFEKLSGLQTDINYRFAHDYDQEIIEDTTNKFRELNHKIVVITQIDPSAGKDIYETAIKSALLSQFKFFLYEFK